MPKAPETKTKFGSDERLSAAIDVLAALTSAPNGRVPVNRLMRDFMLTRQQLESVIAALQQLSDTITGAAAIVYLDGDDLVLEGTAARFAPLRFLPDEAAAVRNVLDRFHLDHEVRERIERALAPFQAADDAERVSHDNAFGDCYQAILIAIADGMPLRISYRSDTDEVARVREIDPHHFEVRGDKAYLIAWDREKDAQRRYRLDRVRSAELVDGSAGRHAYTEETLVESIASVGNTAVLEFRDPSLYERLDWAGIHRDRQETRNGIICAPVSYACEERLLDQVLASGGGIVIVEPAPLRGKLIERAHALFS